MKNIDSFMRFVKAREEFVDAMSRRSRICYEFIAVKIDDKTVFTSPTQCIDDWKGLFESAKFYRDKGHSVRILKGEIDINIK